MLRLNNMDRWALAADALRLVDASKFAEKIDEWENFRQEAFQFACDEGYDHPAFTGWVAESSPSEAAAASGHTQPVKAGWS